MKDLGKQKEIYEELKKRKEIIKIDIIKLRYVKLTELGKKLSKEKISVGDSAIINFKEKKLVKILPISEKSKVMIIGGKHRGEKGVIESVGEKILIKSKESKFEIGKNEIMIIE